LSDGLQNSPREKKRGGRGERVMDNEEKTGHLQHRQVSRKKKNVAHAGGLRKKNLVPDPGATGKRTSHRHRTELVIGPRSKKGE